MASRHLSRSIVMQSLYEWDFYKKERDLKEVVERNIENFGPGIQETEFIWGLVEGVQKHMPELDKIIESLRVILPISLEKVKLRITIPARYSGSVYSALKGKYKFISEKWNNDGSVEIKIQIPAGLKIDFFNLANGLTSGEVIINEEK